MAEVPKTPPLPAPGSMGIIAQINGTFGRIQTIQCTRDDDGSNPYARQLLKDAQERWADHFSGRAPLSGEESLALRAEINRLSSLVNPGGQSMSAGYSAAESAVIAQRAQDTRRVANNMGIAALGPVFGALPAAGRVLGASEDAVESLGELNLNLASAVVPGVRGKRATAAKPARQGMTPSVKGKGVTVAFKKPAKPPKNFKPPTNPPQNPPIPKEYVGEPNPESKGSTIYRIPGTTGDANTFRVQPPNAIYENGYWRQYNQDGNPINPANGKWTGREEDYHVPFPEIPSSPYDPRGSGG